MTDEFAGAVVDDWQVGAKLGEGAMGAVYEARQGDRRAALKIALPESIAPDSLERFRREAHILMKIEHPHVVRCYSAGESDDFVYLALEHLGGGTLGDLLERGGRLSPPQAVWVVRRVLAGLEAIHARGIVHRDVKPDNVLLDAQGTPKLADFSMARAEHHAKITTAGTVLGTFDYMAPEQSRSQQVDARADLYAVGAMLYHLVTGKPPFSGRTGLAVVQQHLLAPVPDVAAEVPEAGALRGPIQALMAKKPEERPQTAQEALALFEGLPEAPIVTGAPSAPLPPRAEPAPPARVEAPAAAAAARPSRLLDALATLLAVGVGLYLLDQALLESGRHPLSGRAGPDAFLQAAREVLTPIWKPLLGVAGFLLLDRLLARASGTGLLGRLAPGGRGGRTS